MKRAISNNICSFCNVRRFSSDSFTQLRRHFSSSTVVLPLKYLCNNSTETFAEKQKFRQKNNPTSSNRVILYYIKTVTFYFFSGLGNKTFQESLNLPVLGSISINFTSISSPSLIPASSTVSKRFQSISEMCSKPSLPGKNSMNAP